MLAVSRTLLKESEQVFKDWDHVHACTMTRRIIPHIILNFVIHEFVFLWQRLCAGLHLPPLFFVPNDFFDDIAHVFFSFNSSILDDTNAHFSQNFRSSLRPASLSA